MHFAAFEALRPVCPVCRSRGISDSALAISLVEAGDDHHVESGIVGCSNCGAEYPVIDGMPILVPDVRRFVEDNLFYLMARTDLPPAVEGLLGDAAGPASGLQSIRQHVSSYAWDHWGEFDPAEAVASQGDVPAQPRPGSLLRALERGLQQLSPDLPPGPVLDIGCGPGRTVAELAARSGRMVVGVDLSVALARVARAALSRGQVDYPRRRIGIVYDRRRFAVAVPGAANADIWICDALALPFPEKSFALVTAMNVLDCVAHPHAALSEIDRVLKPGGEALIALPFDWTGHVTPIEQWLGGHSQRGPHQGDAERVLEMILSQTELAVGSLRRVGEPLELPWHVRLHERSCMHYTVHMVRARRESAGDARAVAGVDAGVDTGAA